MPEKFPIKQISIILKTKIGRVFLSLLAVLSFLISILVIYSINSQSSSPTKSCNDSSITSPLFTADKKNNCLIYLNGLSNGNGSIVKGITLPACNDSNSSYRVNCADPIHLPLCNSIGENSELRNCVEECLTSASDSHNISCVKFCDSSQKNNCVNRKCHQPKEVLVNGSPNGSFEEPSAGCEKISCNLLTEGELSVIAKICKIYDLYKNPPANISSLSETDRVNLSGAASCFEKYCKTKDSIDQNLRCYQYSAKQLPVTRILNCDLHSCNYTNPNNASETISEFSNIVNKNSSYKTLYCKNVKAINNESCSNDSLSNPNATLKYCKNSAILKFSYSCTKANESEILPSVKNNECNTACVQGSCFQEVVCDSNSANPLCSPPVKEYDLENSSIEQKIGSQDLLSYFNRPTPPSSLYNGNNMKAINDKYKGGDATKNGAISSFFTFKCIDDKGSESTASLQKCVGNSSANVFNENKDSNGYCCSSNERVKIDPITDFISKGSILNLGQTDACGTYYQQLGNGSYSPPHYPKNRYGASYHNVGTGRGVGYVYLCGNKGLLYNKVSEQTAYFKGYPQEIWSSDDVNGKRKIKVTVCLRYRNAFYPWGEDTCGARSCVRNCHFFKNTEEDLPCFEYCGEDVCKELEIDESDPKKCSMSDSFLAGNTNECSKLMDNVGLADGYLRLRAVLYGDKVCTFLDVKGQLAYDDSIFIGPNDKIPMTQREMDIICKDQDLEKCKKANETCITGVNDGYGNCIGAFDTTANGQKGLAHVFRPMLRVQYTGSLLGAKKKITGLDNEVPGYYDVSGRFVEEMPCAPIEPRIAPPSQFNLADYRNSSKIFEPPLFISGFTPSSNNSKAVDFFEPELEVTYGNTNLKLKLSKGVKQGVVIDGSQLADIQQKNKNCNYDGSNEVRLFAIKSFAVLGSNINCNDSKLDKPEYYKYIIDDISPFINQSYKNQYSSFEIKDSAGGKIMSYIPLENEQLGQLTRNTYLKSGSDFSLTNNQAEDIRVQKSITLQTVFNQSIVKRVVVFLKRRESLNNPQICLMRREFFVVDTGSSYETKDYEVSCIPIDKTKLNLSVYGKSNEVDEKIDLGRYITSGVNIIDEIGEIYANKRIYYRYAVPKNFNSKYDALTSINHYGEEYYLSSPKSYNNSSCEVNSSLNLGENEQNILLGSDKYVICAQRSYCSSIYNECIASYIQKNRKEILGKDTSVENQTINYCKSLESNCNSLMHFSDNNFPSPYSSDSYKLYSRDKRYSGWFNEICLTKSGLEHLFSRKVVVYNKSGIQGKNSDSACVAKLSSCNSGNNSVKCSCSDADGINCLCVEADLDGSGKSVLPNRYSNAQYDLREKNPHEAGLCVNMPILKSCPALTYETDQERTNASNVGNAEFDVSFPSMKKIKGECKGNWRSDPDISKAVYGECNMLNSTGNIITAENSSAEKYNNANNKVAFSKNKGNCIRYSCPEITAGKFSKLYPDIYADILFPESGYAIYNPNFQVNGEIGDDIGKKLGFSNWQAYLKTRDGTEEVVSSYFNTNQKIYSCIPGYKILNATPIRSSEYMSNQDLRLSGAIYQKITGYSYSPNNLPERQCNDTGNWIGDATNVCQQIKCPAIRPASPLENGISDYEKKKRIAQWSNINGAEFTESLASRTIESGRAVYGSCNSAIGYQVIPGGRPPSRECDYLGNWGPLKNPCSGKCDAIDSDVGNNLNNGFSEWLKVENVDNGQVKIVGASKCIEGYYRYPYSVNRIFSKTNTFNLTVNQQYPASILFDDFGDATRELKDQSSPDSATQSVNNNGLPIRGCFSSSNEFSQFNSTSSARWLAPLSICINKCPSGDLDARIGIGVTEHNSSIGKVRIIWPSTNFGEEVIAYGQINDYETVSGVKYLKALFSRSDLTSSQSISDYIGENRTNGKYLIIRGCGNISGAMAGKWESLNNGCASTSSNSIQRSFSSSDNGVLVNESRSYIATDLNLNGVSCNNSQNYYNANKNTSLPPSYKCSNDGSSNIDKTYYSRVDGTNACSQYCKLDAYQNINGLQSNNSTAIYLNANETQSATCTACGGIGVCDPRCSNGLDLNSIILLCTGCGKAPDSIVCNSSYQLNSTGDCHVCRNCAAGSDNIEGIYTTKQDPDCSTTDGCGTEWCSEGGDEVTFNYYDEVVNATISHNSSIPLSNRSETSCPIGGRYCGCNTKCPDIFGKGTVSCYDGKKKVETSSWINWRYV